jgi:hypothetical protein
MSPNESFVFISASRAFKNEGLIKFIQRFSWKKQL